MVWFVEIFLVLTRSDRLGDWLAGTRVERAAGQSVSPG